MKAILYAFLAAVFYAINIPASKVLLRDVGALLSFVLLKEGLSWMYLAALCVMVAGAALVVVDTLVRHHTHPHQHTFTHFHGGYVHTHTITHTHGHDHIGADGKHSHRHPSAELEQELLNHGKATVT